MSTEKVDRENQTIRLKPSLRTTIKVVAAYEGKKFSDVVEEAIEAYFSNRSIKS